MFDHFRAPRLLSTVAVQKLEVYRYVTTVVQCFVNDVTDNIYKISSKKCKTAKKDVNSLFSVDPSSGAVYTCWRGIVHDATFRRFDSVPYDMMTATAYGAIIS